jgi:hypothetical protein
MLYLYIDEAENKLHCVSKTQIKNGNYLNQEHHVELVVPDDFVFQRSVVDSEGRATVEDLTAEEILASITYAHQRGAAYPSIQDQLDTLYHGGYDAWKASIDAVKEQFPKPE